MKLFGPLPLEVTIAPAVTPVKPVNCVQIAYAVNDVFDNTGLALLILLLPKRINAVTPLVIAAVGAARMGV